MHDVLKDLRRILDGVSPRKTEQLLRLIVRAPRVFVYGLGRSGDARHS